MGKHKLCHLVEIKGIKNRQFGQQIIGILHRNNGINYQAGYHTP